MDDGHTTWQIDFSLRYFCCSSQKFADFRLLFKKKRNKKNRVCVWYMYVSWNLAYWTFVLTMLSQYFFFFSVVVAFSYSYVLLKFLIYLESTAVFLPLSSLLRSNIVEQSTRFFFSFFVLSAHKKNGFRLFPILFISISVFFLVSRFFSMFFFLYLSLCLFWSVLCFVRMFSQKSFCHVCGYNKN